MSRNIIEDDLLKSHLISDLKLVDVEVDFNLEFRGYSKSLCGTYTCKTEKIVIYLYINKEGDRFPYSQILDILLHEAIHHYQHKHQKGYVRQYGVMHDVTFYKLYDEKRDKLTELGVINSEEILF